MRRRSAAGILAWPLLLSIAACSGTGDSTTQGNAAFELVIVGDAPDSQGLAGLVNDDEREQVRSAAARAIARTKRRGGDWDVSYSANGKYRLDKTALPGTIKDEFPFVEGVLVDDEGREIRRWPRMYMSVFISNTGRNLVSVEATMGTGFDFYDLDHPEPIKRFRQHIGGGELSEDGRYFVGLSGGIALFNSSGELLWRKSTEGGGMAFISPGGERVVLAYGRPAKGDEPSPPKPAGDGEPVTVYANNGDVLSEYEIDLYRIDDVTFTDDGRLFAVVGTNEFLMFASDSGTFLKRVAIGPPQDDIANVAFSPGGRYLVAAITRYPTTIDASRTKTYRYELRDLEGELKAEIGVDEVGTIAFTEDGKYIVCERPPRSVFEGGRRVAQTPGCLELIRVRTGTGSGM
jgi:hypothetical protein